MDRYVVTIVWKKVKNWGKYVPYAFRAYWARPHC